MNVSNQFVAGRHHTNGRYVFLYELFWIWFRTSLSRNIFQKDVFFRLSHGSFISNYRHSTNNMYGGERSWGRQPFNSTFNDGFASSWQIAQYGVSVLCVTQIVHRTDIFLDNRHYMKLLSTHGEPRWLSVQIYWLRIKCRRNQFQIELHWYLWQTFRQCSSDWGVY